MASRTVAVNGVAILTAPQYRTKRFRFEVEVAVGEQSRRGDVRYDAILLAALQLLAEVGYDQMRMDAIAERARASKATIYRRWSGKADLVLAALKRHVAPATTAPPDTGSLRGDLVAVLEGMRANLAAQDAAVILGLLTAMRHEPQLADTVRQQFIDVKRGAFDAVLGRAVKRGALPETIDRGLLAEVSSALLFSRVFITGGPLDTGFVEHLVDAVLMPLLDHQINRR
jgi:AcrR family transcriptional regulator